MTDEEIINQIAYDRNIPRVMLEVPEAIAYLYRKIESLTKELEDIKTATTYLFEKKEN